MVPHEPEKAGGVSEEVGKRLSSMFLFDKSRMQEYELGK